MCDRCSQSCQSCWSKHFYQQYLEQHNAMTQWFYQISQSQEQYFPAENPAVTQHMNPCVNYESEQFHQEPVQWSQSCDLVPEYHDHRNHNSKKRMREYSSSPDESSSEESDVSRDDIIGSDDEIYFDPGSLLDWWTNKESVSEKSDNDDDREEEDEEFEIVDSVIEEFEYVQLDKFGNMSENRKGRKGRPHTEKEMKIEKEVREYLYGEKADTIAGLETAMSLDFNRICDLYQPHLWPVLPVRLSKV